MASNLSFRQEPASALATANKLVEVMAEALSEEHLATYFTRHNTEATVRLWQELLRVSLAAAGSSSPQLYYLSDCSTAAVMQQWPEDRANWHRHGALLRLAKIAPMGKWRALREALAALDKQKAAFLDSHGPFLYLVAIGTAEQARGKGLGSVLLDHLCRVADAQQRFVYSEATSEQGRVWLKRQGFFELLRHSVRPHAPAVYVMVRRPTLPAAAAAGTQHQRHPSGSPAKKPAGSVRTR